jgi:hypothetical protein
MLPKSKSEPLTRLEDHTVLIYGPPKIGKSTFCSQAEDALFLATEPGLNSLSVHKVDIPNWETLCMTLKEIKEGNHQFKAIVVDTIDNGYACCADFICAKYGIDYQGDLPHGKGWVLVSNEFNRILTKMAHLPYGLFLVSHAQDKEYQGRTGSIIKTQPSLPDRARKAVQGLVDIILYCDIEDYISETGEPLSRHVIRTKPTSRYEAGDRTGRLPETVELHYGAFKRAFNGQPSIKPTTEVQPTLLKEIKK